jgi:hypothetical protein
MLLAWLTLLGCPLSIGGDLETGPAKEAATPALKVFAVTGDHANQEIDIVADRKDRTTLFAFLRSDKFDRPIARFLRTLDETLRKEDKDCLVVIVWLTDDVEKGKEYLPRVQQSLKLTRTVFTVYPGEMAGPADWAINGDCHVSLIIAHAGKIHATLGYRSMNETDVPQVMKALPKK